MEPKPDLLRARASFQVSSLLALPGPQLGFASHYYALAPLLNNKSFPKYLRIQLFLLVWWALVNEVSPAAVSCRLHLVWLFPPLHPPCVVLVLL